MNNRNLVPLSYTLSVTFFCLAIYSVITHQGNLMIMFIGGSLVTQILFAALSIYELRTSIYLPQNEKSRWTTFLLIAPMFYGIIYLKTLRRRVLYN